jgi:hypothetical protein
LRPAGSNPQVRNAYFAQRLSSQLAAEPSFIVAGGMDATGCCRRPAYGGGTTLATAQRYR